MRYMLFEKTILMVEFLNMLYNDLSINARIPKGIIYVLCDGGNQ